jgi:hypothetical protein
MVDVINGLKNHNISEAKDFLVSGLLRKLNLRAFRYLNLEREMVYVSRSARRPVLGL